MQRLFRTFKVPSTLCHPHPPCGSLAKQNTEKKCPPNVHDTKKSQSIQVRAHTKTKHILAILYICMYICLYIIGTCLYYIQYNQNKIGRYTYTQLNHVSSSSSCVSQTMANFLVKLDRYLTQPNGTKTRNPQIE